MTPCTPAPPCNTEFPLLCEPLETTANGKRLVVEDSAACQKTIQSPANQQILKTDGSGNLTWTNGANDTVLTKSSSGVVEFTPLSVQIPDGSITTDKLANLAVTNAKIANDSVSTSKIANDAVTVSKIQNNAVTTDKLENDAVTTIKIVNNAVTSSKITNGSITAEKLSGGQTGVAPVYGCRAWVNFDGTRDASGAVSALNTNRFIRSSGNVTSVLRTTVGVYTITFTNAMVDANYSFALSGQRVFGQPSSSFQQIESNPPTTTSLSILCTNGSGTAFVDPALVAVQIFGN
jgi:hypothetical protein